MAKALSFDSIADRTGDEIKRPPNPPVGEYMFMVMKPASIEDVGDKWQSVAFQVKAMQAMESVDPEALQNFGDVKNVQLRLNWLLDKEDQTAFDKTIYQIKRFLTDHVKCMGPNDTIKQGMANAVNQPFIGTVSWKADKNDGEIFHANITKTAPAE